MTSLPWAYRDLIVSFYQMGIEYLGLLSEPKFVGEEFDLSDRLQGPGHGMTMASN